MNRPMKGWWTAAFNIFAASPVLLDVTQPLLVAILLLPEFQALVPESLLP